MQNFKNLNLNDVTIMSEREMKNVSGGLENRKDAKDQPTGSFNCKCSSGNGGFMGAGTIEDLIELCEIYCGGNCTC